jgi:hypothetical protein
MQNVFMEKENKVLKEFSNLFEKIKKRPRKLLLTDTLLIIATVLIFFGIRYILLSNKNNSVKDFIVLLKSNLVLLFCLLAWFASLGIWLIHTFWINERTWFGRKKAFALLCLVVLILFVYRGKYNLSSVEKSRILESNKFALDSTRVSLETIYESKHLKSQFKIKELEKQNSQLKERFDSAYNVALFWQQKTDVLQKSSKDLALFNDSLSNMITSLKKENVVLSEKQHLEKPGLEEKSKITLLPKATKKKKQKTEKPMRVITSPSPGQRQWN